MFIDYILDREEKKVKGSFINLILTISYFVLGIWCFFNKEVADRTIMMAPFLTWFFVASFGIWQAKSAIESIIIAMSYKKE